MARYFDAETPSESNRWMTHLAIGGDGVAVETVLVINRAGRAVIVGEALNASVFDIGEAAISRPDFVAFVVPASRGGKGRGNAVKTENRVAHARPAALIAQDFDSLNDPVDGDVLGKPLKGCFREVKFIGNSGLKNFANGYERHSPTKFVEVRANELTTRRHAPRRESLIVFFYWLPRLWVGYSVDIAPGKIGPLSLIHISEP